MMFSFEQIGNHHILFTTVCINTSPNSKALFVLGPLFSCVVLTASFPLMCTKLYVYRQFNSRGEFNTIDIGSFSMRRAESALQ